MKAIIQFDLPEEEAEHLASVQGMDWKIVVWRYREYLLKILHDGNTTTVEKDLDHLHELIENAGLMLD